MGRRMSIDFGDKLCKRKHRWLFQLTSNNGEVIGDGSLNTLPPLKTSRPTLVFKEMSAQHLNEEVFYPAKPDWKPIQITLYDIKTNGNHPVFEWLKSLYDPEDQAKWSAPVDSGFIRPNATLTLFDGCGEVVERWVYQSVWPQTVDFQQLDMGLSEYVTCDLILRYVRAYIEEF